MNAGLDKGGLALRACLERTGPPRNVSTGPPQNVWTGPPQNVWTGPPGNIKTGPPQEDGEGGRDKMEVFTKENTWWSCSCWFSTRNARILSLLLKHGLVGIQLVGVRCPAAPLSGNPSVDSITLCKQRLSIPSAVVHSFRALSGRLKFTVRRHKFNKLSLCFNTTERTCLATIPPGPPEIDITGRATAHAETGVQAQEATPVNAEKAPGGKARCRNLRSAVERTWHV